MYRQGKVRSVYNFDDKLLIVTSDRISAFDHIFKEGIPGKGEVLTSISKYWFETLKLPNHLISTNVDDFPEKAKEYRSILEGRSMIVQKTDPILFECVVRGYIAGSGWKDYQETGQVSAHKLPKGLKLGDKLPEPIFTPATKAEIGDHDENVTIAQMKDKLGSELTDTLIHKSLSIYQTAQKIAEEKGIIIADTKFEFGLKDSGVLLIDEALTPDSSRFWPKESYEPGKNQASFDKQILRDYLESTPWNKQAPIPKLPPEIIQKTAEAYQKIKTLLLG